MKIKLLGNSLCTGKFWAKTMFSVGNKLHFTLHPSNIECIKNYFGSINSQILRVR